MTSVPPPSPAPPPPPAAAGAPRRLRWSGMLLIAACFWMGVLPFLVLGLVLGMQWGASWAQKVPIPPTGPGIGLAPDLSDVPALFEQGFKAVAATLLGMAAVTGVGAMLMWKVCKLLIAPRLLALPAFSRPVPPSRGRGG